jgi:hypothetical protein
MAKTREIGDAQKELKLHLSRRVCCSQIVRRFTLEAFCGRGEANRGMATVITSVLLLHGSEIIVRITVRRRLSSNCSRYVRSLRSGVIPAAKHDSIDTLEKVVARYDSTPIHATDGYLSYILIARASDLLNYDGTLVLRGTSWRHAGCRQRGIPMTKSFKASPRLKTRHEQMQIFLRKQSILCKSCCLYDLITSVRIPNSSTAIETRLSMYISFPSMRTMSNFPPQLGDQNAEYTTMIRLEQGCHQSKAHKLMGVGFTIFMRFCSQKLHIEW